MTLTLTLLRHGRSRADDENVHEGRYDSPLTEVGRAQVRALAARWQREDRQFDRIVASPLCRAAETASIIGDALGRVPETDADLMEMDNGPVAGMPLEEVERQFPETVFGSPYAPCFGSGESEAEFYRRAGGVLERLVRSSQGSLLIVAHGGILNAILRNVVGAPPRCLAGAYFPFGDTGFARLGYEPDSHGWTILSVNDTHHLETGKDVGGIA